jgi:hypothetical protein
VLFVFIAECKLKRSVTISVFGFNLGYCAGASFNNGAGSLPPISAKDAGHPNFFTNNSFHLFAVLAPQVIRTSDKSESILCLPPTFSFVFPI